MRGGGKKSGRVPRRCPELRPAKGVRMSPGGSLHARRHVLGAARGLVWLGGRTKLRQRGAYWKTGMLTGSDLHLRKIIWQIPEITLWMGSADVTDCISPKTIETIYATPYALLTMRLDTLVLERWGLSPSLETRGAFVPVSFQPIEYSGNEAMWLFKVRW